jgi:hypothetical protein
VTIRDSLLYLFDSDLLKRQREEEELLALTINQNCGAKRHKGSKIDRKHIERHHAVGKVLLMKDYFPKTRISSYSYVSQVSLKHRSMPRKALCPHTWRCSYILCH